MSILALLKKRKAHVRRHGLLERTKSGLLQTELLVEAADASAGIDHLLLTGVEGVTLGANFHLDVLLGRASLDHVAAGAPDGGLLVVGMEAFLHCIFTSFSLEDRFCKRI